MSSIGHNAYRMNAVETATPEQLTLMCYDGALRFMRRAERSMVDGDRSAASSAIGRTQAILNELNVTLNMEAGGEISRNLRDIYLFVNRHLGAAISTNDAKKIRESIGLITEIRDAWAEATNAGSAAA